MVNSVIVDILPTKLSEEFNYLLMCAVQLDEIALNVLFKFVIMTIILHFIVNLYVHFKVNIVLWNQMNTLDTSGI